MAYRYNQNNFKRLLVNPLFSHVPEDINTYIATLNKLGNKKKTEKINECNLMNIIIKGNKNSIFGTKHVVTPIEYHVIFGNREIVLILLKNNADLNKQCGNVFNDFISMTYKEKGIYIDFLARSICEGYITVNSNYIDIYKNIKESIELFIKKKDANEKHRFGGSIGGSLNRKCPIENASLYKIDKKKKGLDGKMWIVNIKTNNVKYWKRLN